MSAEHEIPKTVLDSTDYPVVEKSTDQATFPSAEPMPDEKQQNQRKHDGYMLFQCREERTFETVHYMQLVVYLVYQAFAKQYKNFELRLLNAEGVRYVVFSYEDELGLNDQPRTKVHRVVLIVYGEHKDDKDLAKYFPFSTLELLKNLVKDGDRVKDVIILQFKLDDTTDDGREISLASAFEKMVEKHDIMETRSSNHLRNENAQFLKSHLRKKFGRAEFLNRLDLFLGHLVFAIDPADMNELKEKVQKGIGDEVNKQLDSCIKQNIYHKFEQMVLDHIADNKNGCILYGDVVEILKQIKKDLVISFGVKERRFDACSSRALVDLRTFLQADSESKNRSERRASSRTVVICGSEETGKSELTRHFLDTDGSVYDDNLLWIDATSNETMTKSFWDLAQKLKIRKTNIDGKTKDMKYIVVEVYEYFAKRKSLFVLDNAQDYDAVRPFLPSFKPNANMPYIIITSRNETWENIEKLSLNKYRNSK